MADFTKKNWPVHKNSKVLVVGTTSDYIQWIRKKCPGRALFLTEPGIRNRAEEELPAGDEEILCCLDDIDQVRRVLCSHLKKCDQNITGVACFDCESMETAALLASFFSLSYPCVDAILNSRDKYVSKKIWQKSGIPSPCMMAVNSMADVKGFLAKTGNEVVLKPFFGSGSELVFRCRTAKECERAFKIIRDGLEERWSLPLFKKKSSHEHLMLAEELIEGIEFSCDFIVEDDRVTIIRLTRKINAVEAPFGTIMGYVIPSFLPHDMDSSRFERILFNGAKSLGIDRGICMVDFIIRNNEPVLIEMTPRPGGDCLPFLLLEAGNLDIITLALDFAEKKELDLPGGFTPHIGVRIFAHKSGILKRIDLVKLRSNPWIKKMFFIRKPGDLITMPPKDYDSWLLGHVIIKQDMDISPEEQCLLISNLISIEIE